MSQSHHEVPVLVVLLRRLELANHDMVKFGLRGHLVKGPLEEVAR